MKHIVYKTTNKLNNKIYIGIHSTNDLNDDYLGSGRIFIKTLKKYGKDNFIREILFIFKTRIEALEKEKEIVNEEFILSDLNYNCTLGGQGGIGKSNKGRKHTLEAIEKIKEAGKRKCSEETKKKIGNANRGRKMKEEFVLQNSLLRKKYYETHNSPRLGVKLSEETKKKMSESSKGVSWSDKDYTNGKKVINKLTGETYKCAADAIRILKIASRTLYRNIKKENYFLRYE
jgi:group I intron endonuclease